MSTDLTPRTRCIAWRNNYGQSWSGNDAYRCGNNAKPNARFCAHHEHLDAVIETVQWKEA